MARLLSAEIMPSVAHKKKALLIGIKNSGDSEETLDCPHKDVMALREILLDTYEHLQEDIVVMRDGMGDAHLEPTRENILREAKKLVEGAQPGDRFVFHYAGHSTQLPTNSISEEDRRDEYLVPIDAKGNDNLIKDNELRKYLVDSLPAGSTLIAIFDACHSESMLDLEHHRCNRIYIPWISKGKRKSDPKRNVVVRHNDMVAEPVLKHSPRSSAQKRSTLDLVPGSWTSHQHKVASLKSNKLTSLMSLQTWTTYYDSSTSPMQFTESPANIYCTGFCDHASAKSANKAQVLCFSACKDRQRAWENADGGSLTTAMIHILRENSRPTLRDLMTRINHRTYELSMCLHDAARAWRSANRPPTGIAQDDTWEENPLEMDNFQDPQLASLVPLNMDDIFTL